MKKILKKIMPYAILKLRKDFHKNAAFKKYKNLTTKEIFEKIYEERAWGKSNNSDIYSGGGSHEQEIVKPYVESVTKLLSTFKLKPNVVDLGCGDFAVGGEIYDLCNKYIAIDISEKVIKINKIKYKNEGIEFYQRDATKDDLPSADIIFIRQVFQHLSNDDILSALKNIVGKYKYMVITESFPMEKFKANLDKPTGPDCRFMSGVILTSPPFNLNIKSQEILCEVFEEKRMLIKTVLYTF